ncbi:ferritin light chain-like [Panthera tigris]|uniref:ferritin light chain-like n=1 Tax=Panthera tigris TaxID=9694 RepID=UPI001C6F8FEA|nr:ferritin light chain-like [Panthera tigris]
MDLELNPMGHLWRRTVWKNYFTEVEGAVNLLVNTHLQASYTYLSLGFYFDRDNGNLEGMGHLLPRVGKGARVWSVPGSCKVNQAATPSSGTRTRQKLFQDEPQTPPQTDTAPVLVKNLNRARLALRALGSACAGPRLCDFLEDQDEKGIKKMGDHLTHPCRRDGPQAGLGEYFF